MMVITDDGDEDEDQDESTTNGLQAGAASITMTIRTTF